MILTRPTPSRSSRRLETGPEMRVTLESESLTDSRGTGGVLLQPGFFLLHFA